MALSHRPIFPRRGLPFALLGLVAAALVACATPEPEVPPPPPPPPPPPDLALNEGVAQAASVYVAFMREAASIQPGGFADAESIQAAIRRGAAYEPGQLARGMIAYGSILALQSPEFVAGVRTYATDAAQRQEVVARIIADPAYAATLPGADGAAGLIASVLGRHAAEMLVIAEGVENDAYTIQERQDPRRRWAGTHIANREVRLQTAKTLSATEMLPSAEEAARLHAAAHLGAGLDLSPARSAPPYTPATVRSLAIAALAALGAGGDDGRANTDALVAESGSEMCLNLSKLMLFQCLAASRPSYEDMFCAGRHIARDLAVCTAQAAGPAPTPVMVAPPVTAEDAALASSNAAAAVIQPIP